jgi:hypothetical protein
MNVARFSTVSALLIATPLVLASCAGTDGTAGAAGKDGVAGAPGKDGVGATGASSSVSGISPGRIFAGRTAKLLISGYGTAWTDATKVSFGDAGITVKSIKAASPTALLVTVEASLSAALTVRDVTVTEGTNAAKFSGFSVESPISVAVNGTLAQGSIVIVDVQNKDVENPFDTTQTPASPLGGGPTFEGVVASASFGGGDATGINLSATSVTGQRARFTGIIDVDAPAKAYDFEILSGTDAAQLTFLAPASFTVAARTPTVLGAPIEITQGAYESRLYEVTTVKDQLTVVKAVPSAPLPAGAQSLFAVLAAPGRFASNVLATDPTFTTFEEGAGSKLFGMLVDSTGTKGYKMSLSQTTVAPAAVLAEVEPNDTRATAQVAAAYPFVLKTAKLNSATDEDWIKVTAPGGKKLRVQTAAGDRQADTVVTVFATNGTTVIGTSTDTQYHEDFSTAVLAAGTFYVRVTNSNGVTPAAGSEKYIGIVSFE